MIAVLFRKKRLLASVGISLVIHAGLLLFMGFWSLHSVNNPKRYEPVLLTIEPDKLSSHVELPKVSGTPESNMPKASEPVPQRVKKAPSVKALEPLPQVQKKQTSVPPAAPVSKPDTYFPKDSNELPVLPPVKRPVPKGTSRMVYDSGEDNPGDKGTVKDLSSKVTENKNRILSNDEILALSKSLDTGTADTTDKTRANLSETAKGKESVSGLSSEKVPDNISLKFDGDRKRAPLSKLGIEIPEKLLKSIDHDSTIDIKFTLSPEGRILQPEVISSDAGLMVEAAVLKSLRDWAFEADKSTKKNITGRITIKFKVK